MGWDELPSMCHARDSFACISYGQKIFVFGGSALNSAEFYDVETNRWSLLPSMKMSRAACGCARIKDNIYVVGGIDDKDEPLDNVEIFNTVTNSWSTLKRRMKSGRGGCTALAVKDSIYVFGGSSLVEVYNSALEKWWSFPDCLAPQIYSMASVSRFQNKIYIFGGTTLDVDLFPAVRTYDLVTKCWSLSNTNVNSCGHGATIYKDFFVFLVGGEGEPKPDGSRKLLDSTVIYDFHHSTILKSSYIPKMPSGIIGCAAVAMGDALFVLGGHDGSSILRTVKSCKLDNFYEVSKKLASYKEFSGSLVLKEEAKCIVCMESQSSHVFVPCGHLSLCGECANAFKGNAQVSRSLKRGNKILLKCPTCRGKATSLMKVYQV